VIPVNTGYKAQFFRNKPVSVEAFQNGRSPLPEWFEDALRLGTITERTTPADFVRQFYIKRGGQEVLIDEGDYVIRNPRGNITACDPGMFRATYVPDDQPLEIYRKPTFQEIQALVHQTTKSKGWDDQPSTFGDKIALICGEACEALEEWRGGRAINETYYSGKMPGQDGTLGSITQHVTSPTPNVLCKKPEGVPSELADAVIRIMDICEQEGIDLGAAILEKNAFNLTRPYRHGNKRI